MKKRIWIILGLTLCYNFLWSQSCTIPKPLTDEQKAMVGGRWNGHYELNGTRTPFNVDIDFGKSSDQVIISKHPLQGVVTAVKYRFCGAGAFHFRNDLDAGYFEFDGVPDKNTMTGSLVVSDQNKHTEGKFFLTKE